MTNIIERLHTIRNHLRTGALGQREVWEEWLIEAAAEIERLNEVIKTNRLCDPRYCTFGNVASEEWRRF